MSSYYLEAATEIIKQFYTDKRINFIIRKLRQEGKQNLKRKR